MDNSNYTSSNRRLIPSESTSEWFFIVLVCMLWGSGILNFAFVALDKLLGTGELIRSIGRTLLFIFFAIGGLSYASCKLRPIDWLFVVAFIILYFFAPAAKLVPTLDYEEDTHHFLWALPLYLVGISLDFSKMKNLFHMLSIVAIAVMSYYQLFFVHAADYSGSVEVQSSNMSASYGFLLPVMYMIWHTFENFNPKVLLSWVDLASIILGLFSMSMLGTRGSLIGVFLFILLYFFFYKISKHKIIYGILFFIIGYLLVSWSEIIFTFMDGLSTGLGFSNRIFQSFLSGDNLLAEGSSGRDAFYPVLFDALGDSPLFGYGLFGSYEFIQTYPHNIFMEILFSFGYFLGGLIMLFGANSVAKAFTNNNCSADEKGFLFVLVGAGVIGLLFSSMFFITSSFFLFVGYCIQLAYRRNYY